jgi:hypothetical protein
LKKDSFVLGIILGFLAPVIGIVIFYLWKARSAAFFNFLDVVVHSSSLLTAMISFALLANAAAFTVALNARKDKTAKGIFVMTLILAVPAIFFKLFS